jgi:DNA-binding LacI/PurR family transcriptional regulator
MVEPLPVDSPTRERTPAALRIARLLEERIERQEFRPGEWLPTERDLAREFRADRSTIRAAITHLAERSLIVRESGRRPFVRPDSSESIGAGERRIAATDSNEPRPALHAIAAIFPQTPNQSALNLIQRGILRALRQTESPHRLIVFDNQGETWERSVALERQALEAIEQDGVAGGIVWHIGGEKTLPLIRNLVRRGVPLVLLDRRPDDLAGDFVGIDNRQAACEAVQYLLKLGHRRIAHLTSNNSLLTVREREAGYKDALLSYGLTPSEDYICRVEDNDDLYPDIGEAMNSLLALPEPPTALFALKDLMAHAVIRDLRERGLHVPDDMSVIGFDDHDRHSLQPPILTTVHQPFEAMGQQAANLLLRRLSVGQMSGLPAQHVLLPTPLVLRSTCAAPKESITL